MPDLNDDPGAPAEPGEEDAATLRASRPAGPDAAQKRKAVTNVLALLGKSAKPGAKPSFMVPSARARAAIDRLVSYGTVEKLEEAQIDVKALAHDLLDWGMPAGKSHANKLMTRTIASALLSRDANGRSQYAQAVEMLSFASAVSTLLEPDRLTRLIQSFDTVETAFSPERYTMQLAAALRTILTRFPQQRRETLLISLWQQAHTGRWWDMTSGVITVRNKPGRRVGVPADERAEHDDERAAAAQAVRELLAGATEGTPDAHRIITEAWLAGTLSYSAPLTALLHDLPETAKLRTSVVALADVMHAGATVNPDEALYASHLRWLLPAELPETPITWLVKTLVTAITPDPESGEASVESLPEKPKEFSALYPLAELRGFPFPAAIHKLHSTILPGTTEGNVVVELVHNPSELAENRDHMGNCTWSYKDRMETGSYALLKLWRGTECVNVSLLHGDTGWHLGECNGRFNRTAVPEDIRTAVTLLIAALPAPGPLREIAQHARREVRYGVA
jgi:hypothetical protein